MKKQVKAYLNSLFKLVIELSVAEIHFVKPGLIKHVLLVWMGHQSRNSNNDSDGSLLTSLVTTLVTSWKLKFIR